MGGLEDGYFNGEFLFKTPGPNGKALTSEELYKAAGFTLGKKEKIGEHEAQVIDYSLYSNRRISLWLDTRTNLPLKRVVVSGGVQGVHTTTETYTALSLDGQIDPKSFEWPKE